MPQMAARLGGSSRPRRLLEFPMPKLTTAAFAALLAACAGLGWVSWETSQSASDAAAAASRALSDAQAETESVRGAFQYLGKFGKAVMLLEARCRQEEGSSLAAVEFSFTPSGQPDKARAMCHPRRTGT